MSIDRYPNQQDLSWFIDMENQERLDLNPRYQRLSVWKPKDRYFFLDTIFNNFPCPAIYLQKENSSKGPVFNVVDGKQRLQTVLNFHKNKYRIPKDFSIIELRGKRFKDIGKEYISIFYNYVFSVEQLRSQEDEDWNEVFHRVNRNQIKLSDQELRHAKFDGWFINRAESEVADLKNDDGLLWKNLKVSSTAKNKRMKDVEFISILMLVVLEKKFIGFPQIEIDALYAKYDFEIDELSDNEDEATETNGGIDELLPLTLIEINEFETRFTEIKQFLAKMEETNNCITQNSKKITTDLYSLWALLHMTDVMEKYPAEKVAEIYADFISQVYEFLEVFKENGDISTFKDPIKKYANFSSGATTEEGPRKKRHEAFLIFVDQYES